MNNKVTEWLSGNLHGARVVLSDEGLTLVFYLAKSFWKIWWFWMRGCRYQPLYLLHLSALISSLTQPHLSSLRSSTPIVCVITSTAFNHSCNCVQFQYLRAGHHCAVFFPMSPLLASQPVLFVFIVPAVAFDNWCSTPTYFLCPLCSLSPPVSWRKESQGGSRRVEDPASEKTLRKGFRSKMQGLENRVLGGCKEGRSKEVNKNREEAQTKGWKRATDRKWGTPKIETWEGGQQSIGTMARNLW